MNKIRKYFFCFQGPLKETVDIWYSFFLNCLVENSLVNPTGTGAFCFGWLLNIDSVFSRHRHIQIIYFLSCKQWLFSPRNWYILSRLSTVRAKQFLIVLFYSIEYIYIHFSISYIYMSIEFISITPILFLILVICIFLFSQSELLVLLVFPKSHVILLLLIIFSYWFPVFNFFWFFSSLFLFSCLFGFNFLFISSDGNLDYCFHIMILLLCRHSM